jgi:hypothetical protein
VKAIKAGPVGNLGARWPSDPVRCDIIYDGEVKQGDAVALEAAYDQLLASVQGLQHGFQTILPFLCLRSPGGSVEEGLRVARFVREAGIATVVEDGVQCASMCAVIFLAGTSRLTWQGRAEDRIEFPRRFLHPRGRLIFHSPYLNMNGLTDSQLMRFLTNPEGGGIKAQVYDLYRSGLSAAQRIIETFASYSQASYRLGQPWVRQSLLLDKMANGSREWVCVDTVDAAGRWDIDVFGYKPPTAPTNEQLYNMCHSVQHWRQDLAAAGEYTRPATINVSTAADRRVLALRRVYYNSLVMQCVITSWPKRAEDLDEMASLLVQFQTDKGERVSEALSTAPFAFSELATLLADLPGVRARPASAAAQEKPPMAAHRNKRMSGCSYRTLARSTHDACRDACTADAPCRGFSFSKMTGTCELKHTRTALRLDPVWDSGVAGEGAEDSLRGARMEVLAHERRPAGNGHFELVVPDGVQLEPESAADASICLERCASSGDCLAATFEAKDLTCRRFESITGTRSVMLPPGTNSFGTSWVKRQ